MFYVRKLEPKKEMTLIRLATAEELYRYERRKRGEDYIKAPENNDMQESSVQQDNLAADKFVFIKCELN